MVEIKNHFQPTRRFFSPSELQSAIPADFHAHFSKIGRRMPGRASHPNIIRAEQQQRAMWFELSMRGTREWPVDVSPRRGQGSIVRCEGGGR